MLLFSIHALSPLIHIQITVASRWEERLKRGGGGGGGKKGRLPNRLREQKAAFS